MKGTIVINGISRDFRVEELSVRARGALAEILNLDSMRAELFEQFNHLPRTKKIREQEVLRQCPERNKFDVYHTREAQEQDDKRFPGFMAELVTHKASGHCASCGTTHEVTRQGLRLYCEVQGVPFSREVEPF